MRGNVRQRAKGTWTLTIELPPDPATGKRRQAYETVRGAKRDAFRRLNELEAQVHKGEYVSPSHLTLGQYLDQWKSHAATTTRVVTAEGYVWYVDHYIKPSLGHLSLDTLQPTHVQQLLADLLKRGLSAQTVRNCRTIFRNALGQAVNWGMLTRNVVDATAPPRGKPREIKTLTPEEVERLLSVAQESEYYPAIFTALWTGMRRSELLGLRWRDVDLVLGTINVARVRHRLRGGRTVYEEPKSRMGKRAISMPPPLTILLREQRDRQAAVRECLGQDLGLDDLIFTWPDGRPHASEQLLSCVPEDQTQGRTGCQVTRYAAHARKPPA